MPGRGPLRLTSRGRERWRAATEQRTAYERGLLEGALDTAEVEQLNLLLAKLLTRLEDEFGPAPTQGPLRRK